MKKSKQMEIAELESKGYEDLSKPDYMGCKTRKMNLYPKCLKNEKKK